MTKKLDSNSLKATIALQKAALFEGMNSSEAKSLFTSVTDLYDELNEFEEEAPAAAINALTPHLKNIKDVLEQMMQNPMSYVSKPVEQQVKKVIKLAPVVDDD